MIRCRSPDGAAAAPCAGKFQTALAWQGVDMDMDGVECLLANLIYRRACGAHRLHTP